MIKGNKINKDIDMNAEEIALRLGGAGKGGERGYMCLCPVHEDNSPSLSIMDGEGGKILVNCFAGCDGSDIIAALKQKGMIKRRRTRTRMVQKRRNRDTVLSKDESFSCSSFPQMPFDLDSSHHDRHVYMKRRQTSRERAIYGRLPWEIEDELREMREEMREIHNENEKTDSK